MTTEFLGEKAVRDLFDIIAENFYKKIATDSKVEEVLSPYFNDGNSILMHKKLF